MSWWQTSIPRSRAFALKERKPLKPTTDLRQEIAQNEDYVPPVSRKYDEEPVESEREIFQESDPVKPVERKVKRTVDSGAPKNPVRKCADCKNPPHMQCLHCSKHVCMECAQKHVALATEQIDVAQHVLNDKMSIIDRLSAAAKERVNADRNRIIKQADIERDQVFVQIDHIAEQQKKQIRDKSAQLSELPLDEIPSFIQRMTTEMEYVNEANNRLFLISSTLPKIQMQQQPESHKEKL